MKINYPTIDFKRQIIKDAMDRYKMFGDAVVISEVLDLYEDEFKALNNCPTCIGFGWVTTNHGRDECPDCKGKGK